MYQQIATSMNLMAPKTEVSVGESKHFFFANHKKFLRFFVLCAKILTNWRLHILQITHNIAVDRLINYHRDAAVIWLISTHKFLFIGVISWEKLLNFTWLCQ